MGSEIHVKVADKGITARRLAAWFVRNWLWSLILVAAVVVVYQPVWYAGFIWDDDDHVTANPVIVGPLGLKEIWTTGNARYYPFVLTTFWVEHALWGLAPLPYHLVNVLLHAASAVVLWRVLLSLQVPGAWLGAALWALHPVEVESVAWISEMKNTESGLFYLLAIFFFVKWLRTRELDTQTARGWNYALTLFFAALAMTSKSSTVVLPIILCLCAWWVEGRWRWRNLARVGPILLMSLAAAVLAMWSVELYGDAHNPHWARSWPERLITTGRVIRFYLGKLAWPHPLIFIYPRWEIHAGRLLAYMPLLGAMTVLAFLWFKRETWLRPYFFTLAYFLAALLPVLGLIDHYFLRYSFVADHLQYLASMGPLALVGAGLARLGDFALPRKPWMQSGLGAVLLAVLGLVSWQRAWVYESAEQVWNDTLAHDPTCWMAHNNLGTILLSQGKPDEAMVHFEKVLKIRSDDEKAYNNMGLALAQKGRVDEAISMYQRALTLNANFADAYNNLGISLSETGKVEEGMAEFQKALAINPNDAQVHINLGHALLDQGQIDEAVDQFQQALALNPNEVEAYYNLGNILLQKGRVDEAIIQFQKALAINANDAEVHNSLGIAFSQEGKMDEAIAEFKEAIRLNPHSKAQDNLIKAEATGRSGRPR